MVKIKAHKIRTHKRLERTSFLDQTAQNDLQIFEETSLLSKQTYSYCSYSDIEEVEEKNLFLRTTQP